MIFKDYYKILGLETNKVNIDEIKVAFREQAKKYHPDVNSDNFSEERFKDINEAYRVLSDNSQKRKYKKKPIKDENIETGIDITIEEAYYGVTKKISLRTVDGKMKTFSVKIPAGIRNGEKIRFIGEGKLGQNGAKNGDLFIKVNIDNTKKYKLLSIFIIAWIPYNVKP